MQGNNTPDEGMYDEEGLFILSNSNEELNKIMEKKKNERAKMMEGVATQKEVFTKEPTQNDLIGGSLMKNKIKSITDSYKEFSAMLRETAADRKVDLTEEEQEHIRSDVISTSMATAHAFYKANSYKRGGNRK